MNLRFTLHKAERLSHRKHIDNLFEKGTTFNLSPFKIFYLLEETVTDEPVAILVTVPKKRFRRAVDRNRLRRLIRETYRLHKHGLIEKVKSIPGISLHIGFVYIGDRKDIAFVELEKQMVNCLERLGRIVSSSSTGGGNSPP
jgi:ribonuclease P protein component